MYSFTMYHVYTATPITRRVRCIYSMAAVCMHMYILMHLMSYYIVKYTHTYIYIYIYIYIYVTV